MKIAVRYKMIKINHDPVSVIVDIPENTRHDEDSYWGACHDAIEEIIGETPKWIRVLGKVEITPIFKI